MGVEVNIIKVTGKGEIMGHGVMSSASLAACAKRGQIDAVIKIAQHTRDGAAEKLDQTFDEAADSKAAPSIGEAFCTPTTGCC